MRFRHASKLSGKEAMTRGPQNASLEYKVIVGIENFTKSFFLFAVGTWPD
jgi:hypothetical protein